MYSRDSTFNAEIARHRPPGVDEDEWKVIMYADERPWKYTWVEEREAAAVIGYNESTWDAHLGGERGSGVTAPPFKKFASLSYEQQRAAAVLALDEEACMGLEVVHLCPTDRGHLRLI